MLAYNHVGNYCLGKLLNGELVRVYPDECVQRKTPAEIEMIEHHHAEEERDLLDKQHWGLKRVRFHQFNGTLTDLLGRPLK